MGVDPDPGVENVLEGRCEICGTPLTEAEIDAAREAGRPFLCAVHGTEELPAQEESEAPDPESAA